MLDLLFTNGRIYTLAEEGDCCQSIGVKDGKIAFVGTDAEAKTLRATRSIDLEGKTMIPGMGDSHMHFYAYCQTLTQVNLGNCTSKKEMLQKLKEVAEKTPKGRWIRGANFDQSKWKDCADRLPTRHDLDEVSKDHPIVIKRVCLHTAVANTKALVLAGIDHRDSDGPGGVIEREANGMPNGILREQLIKIFDEMIPDPLNDYATKMKIMAKELQHMASLGMTMMHTYAAEIWKYVEDVNIYDQLDRENALPLRVFVYTDLLSTLEKESPIQANDEGDPHKKTQLSGFKLFCDGSLGSRSAALYEGYTDDPENVGILVDNYESMTEKMYRAALQGIQCAIHAIGDRALDIVLSAIESTMMKLEEASISQSQIEKKPFRLIHAQMATDHLIKRMKKLPIIIDVQPSFLETDRYWVKERIGETRFQKAYPWKTYIRNGMMLTGGSDAPVESFNPLAGIYNCMTHLNPAERLSAYESVCLFSKNLPYATGDAQWVGTLEVGKFADLVVLSRDIFNIPAAEILDIKIERTLLAGKETWVRC